MYDFRLVKKVKQGDEEMEFSTLAAPADLIKALDANPRSSISSLFGGVIDENDTFRPCNEGEEPTHYVGSGNPDRMILFKTPGYISIAVGDNDLANKFQKLAGGTVFFNRDDDGAIYAMLNNGSKYYLTKKKVLVMAEDGSLIKPAKQLPGIFESDMISMVHTDPEQVVYNIVRAYMGKIGSTILFDKCRNILMNLYHGMDIMVHYNVTTNRVDLSLDYTEESLNKAACMLHGSKKPFGFRMIYNEPGGNVLLTVNYQLSIKEYLKIKRKHKISIEDVDILLACVDELSKDKYRQSR